MGAVSFACVTMIGDNLRHLWFGISPVSDVRSQPSGSMVVHLEVFTNRARHASPLHRCAPDKTRTACRWRSMGAVSFVCVTTIDADLRKSASSAVQYSRSTIGVDGRSPGGFYKPGDACVAPTQIYRTHRAWDGASTPVAFLCRASTTSSWRVEELFRWSSLPAGRGMRHPYKDLPLPRSVRRAGAFSWASFHSVDRHVAGVGRAE